MPWMREEEGAENVEPHTAEDEVVSILDQGHPGELEPAMMGHDEEPQYAEEHNEGGCYEPPRWLEDDDEGHLNDEELRDFFGPTD